MAQITLKDLLPGLIGFGVGAVSPQTGRAGALTLETMQDMQDRNRQRKMMDERQAWAKSASEREAAGERRAIESHAWAGADQLYQDRTRREADEERAQARQTASTWVANYERDGSVLPEDFKAPLLNAENFEQFDTITGQVRQWEEKQREFKNDTPLSWEYAKSYQGPPFWASVRHPSGSVVKMQVGKAQGSTDMEGVTSLVNALQTARSSRLSLEQATASQDVENAEARGKAREAAGMSGPVDINPREGESTKDATARGAESLLATESYSLPASQKVETAEQGVGFADQDLMARIMANPQALQQIVGMVAAGILPPDILPPQMMKGQPTEVAPKDGPSSEPGSLGRNKVKKYITG